MENKPPLITIGITCFNAADSIARALESACKQDWKNVEIVIVDDCSNDQSTKIIYELKAQNPPINLIIHEQNKGVGAARQTIVENAKGDFIAFFDDDDESAPQRLTKQYQAIIEYELKTKTQLVACYASGQRIYPNGYTLDLAAIGSKERIPHGEKVANRLLFFGDIGDFFFGTGTPACSLMARKTTFEKVGGFDRNFRRVEDIDLAIRLALRDCHFIGTPEKLFTQYATNGGDKVPQKNLDAEQQLAQKHKNYLVIQNKYIYAHEWPRIRYFHFTKNYVQMFFILLKLFFIYPKDIAKHFFNTGTKRLIHERKMKKDTA